MTLPVHMRISPSGPRGAYGASGSVTRAHTAAGEVFTPRQAIVAPSLTPVAVEAEAGVPLVVSIPRPPGGGSRRLHITAHAAEQTVITTGTTYAHALALQQSIDGGLSWTTVQDCGNPTAGVVGQPVVAEYTLTEIVTISDIPEETPLQYRLAMAGSATTGASSGTCEILAERCAIQVLETVV